MGVELVEIIQYQGEWEENTTMGEVGRFLQKKEVEILFPPIPTPISSASGLICILQAKYIRSSFTLAALLVILSYRSVLADPPCPTVAPRSFFPSLVMWLLLTFGNAVLELQ